MSTLWERLFRLLPERVGWWAWSYLTGLIVYRYGRAPDSYQVEHVKLVGILRWWSHAMDAPRPTWSQLERWANLDDPKSAELRAAEVRRAQFYVEEGQG